MEWVDEKGIRGNLTRKDGYARSENKVGRTKGENKGWKEKENIVGGNVRGK